MIEHPLVLTDFIPVVKNLPHHITWTIIADLVIFFAVIKGVKAISIIPSAKLNLSVICELITEFISNMLHETFGDKGRKYTYLIGTLFIFIFVCNFLGLIPGFFPATEDFNTNLAMSLAVFVIYNFYGIQKQGLWKYFKHMMGPMPLLAPLMLPIELISHFARIVSLAMRLFGNIFGDHKVLLVVISLVPLVIPVAIYGMGVLVAVLQAYVFTLLSTVYIQLAIQEEEH